jgi:uncharacterized membrane protein YdbT with pleckstrin-like domain
MDTFEHENRGGSTPKGDEAESVFYDSFGAEDLQNDVFEVEANPNTSFRVETPEEKSARAAVREEKLSALYTATEREDISAARMARGMFPSDIAELEDLDVKAREGVTVSIGEIKVLWTIQTSSIIIVIIAVAAMCWKCAFVFVPMLMAYFYTYMMAPFMDLLERRPYPCFGPCGKLPPEPTDWEKLYGSKMLCIGEHDCCIRCAPK